MSKAEQLIEYIIRDIIEFQLADNKLDVKNAMSKFYNSEVCGKLSDVETGLYLCSSSYVYELFCDELDFGKIVQQEI
jgi:hypothetical protein